jgi:hypothetical protein
MDTPIWATRICRRDALDHVLTRTRLARWEASTPGNSLTHMTLGRPGRPSLTHLLTDRAFNATTSTNVATTPLAWEQRLRLVLLFTAHPGMGNKRQPLFRHDTHYSTVMSWDFLGLGLIHSPSTLLRHVPNWPRSPLVEQGDYYPYVDHRESHVLYSTPDVPPSHHQHHHDAPGMAYMYRAHRHSNTNSTRSAFS